MKISQALVNKYKEKIATTIEQYECPFTKVVKAAEVQDLTNLDQRQRWNTYLSVGHEPTDDSILWAYVGGQIQTEKNSEGTFHHLRWDGDTLKNSWYGRVAKVDGKVVVTMNRPWTGYDPDSESRVKRLLFNQFSPDQIKVFG